MKRKRHPHSAAASSTWQGYHDGDMAEVPVTCLLGSLGPLLHRLQVLMDTEGNLPRGVSKSDLRNFRRDLEDVSRSVMEISREDNPHFTDKLWVKEVRELTYDAEDYLDMVLASANSGVRQIPWIQKRRKGPRITKDISDLRSRLHQARDRRHRYKPIKPNKAHTEHIGLEEPMGTVVNLLDLDKEPNLKVVPIFGVAGVGKTTLATRLYHHYGGSFHRRAFLRVSRQPDIRSLLASMLSQIKGPKPCTDVQDLINSIRKCLDDKSYFIVFDDLWDTSAWDIISHALPARKCYSRIITTTEIEQVALACCSYRTKDMYTMDPLKPYQAQKLLLSRTFGSKDECHGKEVKDDSDAIIRKSDGLPLAIVQIASMLASWSKIEMEHKKKYIQESLRVDPTSEWMKEILNLVYSDLPDHLKTCLLYFNMYPEDYVIRKDDLVKQWVAEGFLTSVKLKDMEHVAGIYFDELVTRGMIQPLETNSNDEVLSCAVHHMVLDLIAQKSTEENFITVMYYNGTVTGLSDKVRRLSLKFGAAESARITGSFRMSQVRSLIFSGLFTCVPSLVEYRLLQVLILHIWSDQDKKNFNLARIQEMFRLRYLKVESNMTVKLPASIAGLQCLGTMEIHARVAAIPSDIVRLQRLLHLCLPSGIDLPHGIGHMTSLRSLSYFNISTSSRGNVLDLGKLTNLHDLHLTSSKVRSKRLYSNMKLLASILGSINLRSLTLDGGDSSDGSIPCEGLGSVSSDSCPPFLLERLKLSPGICIFFHIPNWVGELSKLCVLKIAVKELSSNDVDTLKELPALSALSLYVQVTPEKLVIDKKGFSVLKNFKFICRMPCLEFMSGAMPNVRRLKLCFSAYRGLEQCSGLENLESLSVVYAKVEGAGVDDSRRKAIQSQLKDTFKTSPVFQEKKTFPVVNVLWVDRVFDDNETHPGSRSTTSSSESSSSTTNPGEYMKRKKEEKKYPSATEQHENEIEGPEEQTIPEKGLVASDRIDLSTEASPCTRDQVGGEKRKTTDEQGVIILEGTDHEQVCSNEGVAEDTIDPADKRIYCVSKETSPSTLDPEDDSSTGTQKEAIRTTDGQNDTKEDDSEVVGYEPPESELGDATKERSGSMGFTSKGLSLNLQYPGCHVKVEVPTTTEQTQETTTEETRDEITVEQDQEVNRTNDSMPTSYRVMMELRKYILLLASLVAAVTYTTGFNPPGGVWKETAAGHSSGDPIIRDTNYNRYLVFYYCNSTAFAASLAISVLILILASLDEKDNNTSSKIVQMIYKNNPTIAVRILQVVMVLDLLSLMGAYAAGTFRDMFSAVYSSLLIAITFAYLVVQITVASCYSNSGSVSSRYPEAMEESPKAKERFRKVLMLLATFAVNSTYLSGMSAPGGFWDTTEAGHRPGDAILKDRRNTRLAPFFGLNTMAFVASLLTIVVLLDRKLRKKNASLFIITALSCLFFAYSAGIDNIGHSGTILSTAIVVYILFLGFLAPAINAIWKAMTFGIHIGGWQSCIGRVDRGADKARSLVLLLATLAATVTYQAGLHPPGGTWEDNTDSHNAGDPILLTTNSLRYNVFFYCNSITFVASLVAIVLVQKKLLLRHYVLETVVILGLFGLIGAYVAGSCWDLRTSLSIMCFLPIAAIAYGATYGQTDNSKEDKRRKRFLLFAIVSAIIAYQAGLSPPGGFLLKDNDQSGHHAGYPVLFYSSRGLYWAFLYCNSATFMLSIGLIVIIRINMYNQPRAQKAEFVLTVASLVNIMGAYTAGSTRHSKTFVYTSTMLVSVALPFVVLLLSILRERSLTTISNSNTSSQGTSNETIIQLDENTAKEVHAKRKYLVLVAILIASVTYKAGLEPPGGVWKSSSGGYEAGNPIMHDIRRSRYLVFFYSNSMSFNTSIVVILLVSVLKKLWLFVRIRLVLMNTTVVLHLLGLLVAYAAGAIRTAKTSLYFFFLVITMPVIVVTACTAIHLVLSIISKRSQSMQENNRVQESPPV